MSELTFLHLGFGEHAVPYEDGWARQRQLHEQRVAGEIPDTCVLLEHPPVYTAGKRTEPADRPVDGTPVVDVDRGGRITWHGPGQLVGYPIIKLPDPVDVVGYVRMVEEAMIRMCADVGVQTTRVDGRSGVWVPGDPARGGGDSKIGAVGIRVSRGVTMHGFALNCDCDMSWYEHIVACGIPDAASTSLSIEAGRQVTVQEVIPLAEHHLADTLTAPGAVRTAPASTT